VRRAPLAATRVLQALERFGPQARPYNFDDVFDCWGLVRRVFDDLDDGYEVNEELADDERGAHLWAPIEERSELLPGDLLTTHPHAASDFHTVFYCGRVGEVDVVYDSSPRGLVPLFDDAGRLVDDRALFTRFMRATETTDRLRHDGGAYLRLWDDRERFYNRTLHERLLAASPERERDLVRLRREAGLSDLPFYCRDRLERDIRGREVYDNRATRHLDYYVPDGGPAPDDAYGTDCGALRAAGRRPAPPALVSPPHLELDEGPWTVEWAPGSSETVDGWRLELWEETWDLWRHRLLRLDLPGERRSLQVTEDLLSSDTRFAVVLFAHGDAGYSGTTLATVLWRARPDHPLRAYDPVRPSGLWPDLLEAARPGPSGLELRWSIADPAVWQRAARVRLFEDACLADDVEPVFETTLEGDAAAPSRLRGADRGPARGPHLRLVRRRVRRTGPLGICSDGGVVQVRRRRSGGAAPRPREEGSMLNLAVRALDLETAVPFGLARWSHSRFENFVVELSTTEGLAGLGEAAPNRRYGETRDAGRALLVEAAPEIADLESPAAIEVWCSALGERAAGNGAQGTRWPAVRSGLSAAAWDLAGKQEGEPVWKLLGLERPEVTTSYTIAIGDPEEMLEHARHAAATYGTIKVKLGFEGDVEFVRGLAVALPETRLRLDVNEGWEPERAASSLALLEGLDIELVEQPLPADAYDDQAWLGERTALPLFADEAVVSLTDLDAVAALYDGVVVKLQKAGGLAEAFALISACRERGLQVLLGCMVESSLGIAASLQLAGLCDHVDLDGALLLASDPYEGVEVEGERLRASEEPGLGVRLRPS
jgi:L-Ala-D/L-Glu epimerase